MAGRDERRQHLPRPDERGSAVHRHVIVDKRDVLRCHGRSKLSSSPSRVATFTASRSSGMPSPNVIAFDGSFRSSFHPWKAAMSWLKKHVRPSASFRTAGSTGVVARRQPSSCQVQSSQARQPLVGLLRRGRPQGALPAPPHSRAEVVLRRHHFEYLRPFVSQFRANSGAVPRAAALRGRPSAAQGIVWSANFTND